MTEQSNVLIFIDEEAQPIATLYTPVSFELDTRKLTDGQHQLKIISRDSSGKEGIRIIPFIVRNGPAISIEGIQENDTVDGVVPLMVNAYGKSDQRSFIITGSETPHSIPSWVWILIISFVAWALYYLISYLNFPGSWYDFS